MVAIILVGILGVILLAHIYLVYHHMDRLDRELSETITRLDRELSENINRLFREKADR